MPLGRRDTCVSSRNINFNTTSLLSDTRIAMDEPSPFQRPARRFPSLTAKQKELAGGLQAARRRPWAVSLPLCREGVLLSLISACAIALATANLLATAVTVVPNGAQNGERYDRLEH